MAPTSVPWDDLDTTLGRVTAGDPTALTGPWATYASVLASYRLWRGGDREAARALAAGVPGVLGTSLRDWYAHLAPAQAVTG